MNPFQNGMVQASYVIHARQFTERAAYMKAQLEKFQIPFEFIEPYDADAIDAETTNRYLAKDCRLSLGIFSCALKHIEALRRIAAKDYRVALVLEDDVILDKRFNEEVAKIVTEAKGFGHPHTIQIGCANNMYVPAWRLRPGKRLYEADQVRAADSYLIGADAARLRLAWLERNQIDRPSDHLFNVMDREMGIRFYWTSPTIVDQGSMNGLFQSALSDKRNVRALWHTRLHFQWNRLYKKYVYRLFQ